VRLRYAHILQRSTRPQIHAKNTSLVPSRAFSRHARATASRLSREAPQECAVGVRRLIQETRIPKFTRESCMNRSRAIVRSDNMHVLRLEQSACIFSNYAELGKNTRNTRMEEMARVNILPVCAKLLRVLIVDTSFSRKRI
jgi:hypothetical protein